METIVIVNTSKIDPLKEIFESEARIIIVTRSEYVHFYDHHIPVIECNDLKNASDLDLVVNKILYISNKISAVIGISENSVYAAGYLREKLGCRGISLDTAICCTDKFKMKEAIARAGVKHAKFFLASSFIELERLVKNLQYMVVIKPITGSGSVGTFKVTSPQQWENVKENFTLYEINHIVEEVIDIEIELHIDSIILDENIVFSSVSRYIAPVLDNISNFIGSISINKNNQIYDKAIFINSKVIKAVNFSSGVSHLEIFISSSGDIVFGEIAARPAGGCIPRMIELRHRFPFWKTIVEAMATNTVPLINGDSEKIIVGCELPADNGILKYITPPSLIEDIFGLIEVKYKYNIGDRINDWISSSFYAGLAFGEFDTEEEALYFIESLKNTYKIAVIT